MIDTNTITATTVQTSATGFLSSLNAWHLVALGVGAGLVHAYHTIVNAGGYVNVWLRFKYGPTGKPNPTLPPQ